MTIKSSGLLVSDLISVLPDNSTAEISPQDVRDTLINIVDSVPLLSSGNGDGVPHWLVTGRLSASNFDTPDSRNTLGGRSALDDFTAGSAADNTAFGFQSLTQLTTGDRNTAVGSLALKSHMINGDNVAVGYSALETNTTGSGNVALGAFSLECNTDGSGNVAIGPWAGHMYEGNDGLFIANRASKTLIRGDFDLDRVGIAESAPLYTLDVSGVARIQDNLYAAAKLGVNTISPAFTADIVGDLKYTGSGDFATVYAHENSIFNYRKEDIDFLVNCSGAPGIFVDSDRCRVGINTSTVSADFHINAVTFIQDATLLPSPVTNRLYAYSGDLYWKGLVIGSGQPGNLWSRQGSDVFYNVGDVAVGNNLGVSGNIDIADASLPSTTGNRLYANAGNLYWDGHVIGSGQAITAGVWTKSGTEIYYDADNVGVGLTDPTSTFHVNGTIDTDTIAIGTSAGISGVLDLANIAHPATSGNRLYAVNSQLFWGGTLIGSGVGGGGGGGLWSLVGADAVFNTGNVGVDVASVTSKFQVAGNIDSWSIFASGDVGVSGVVKIENQGFPADTSQNLYANAGNLYWDGHVIGSGVPGSQGVWSRTGSDIYYNDGNVGFNNDVPSNLIHASGGATVLDMWIERRAGISGDLRLEDIPAPSDVTNKLYANDGNLYWNGSVMGTESSTTILEVQVFS